MDVVGDKVVVCYLQGSPLAGIAERNLQKEGSAMRIYPLVGFYERVRNIPLCRMSEG